jgi:hypothetical protein
MDKYQSLFKKLVAEHPHLEASFKKLCRNDHDELLMFADFIRNGQLPKADAPADMDFKKDPPQDGTKFYGRYVNPFRWHPYSPKSQEFKQGIKGRWQMMDEYGGWKNTHHIPDEWMGHEVYMKGRLSGVTKSGERG